jgi:hypothetical protein
MPIKPADRARGQRIETLFKFWLDRDGLPYVYVDQSMFTVPANMRGLIKRPDFAVGIPNIGLIAFDVKAKALHKGQVLIDLDEHRKLLVFETCFHMVVWYAVFPPRHAPYAYLFRNRDLAGREPISLKGKPCLRFAVDDAVAVNHRDSELLPAIMRANVVSHK